ncbi:MAG: hypothetical protein IJZ47_12275 [Oscillospiraceae bacterium]|nr:hypothetical protein [Oscillospiraceae bacterium]
MRSRINVRALITIAAIILFIGVLCWFLVAVNTAEEASDSQSLEALRSSVENSITLCYSIEGAYPEDLKYLTEHYGLRYDESRYVIHYDCFAANIRPSVTVIERVR